MKGRWVPPDTRDTVVDYINYSRFIVHWEISESMREQDVEMVRQKAMEKYPGAKPRIISDNGPQFSAIDYVTPADKLAGRAEAIAKSRDRKLEAAREQRRAKRASGTSCNAGRLKLKSTSRVGG